jgi:hypothetical protein
MSILNWIYNEDIFFFFIDRIFGLVAQVRPGMVNVGRRAVKTFS